MLSSFSSLFLPLVLAATTQALTYDPCTATTYPSWTVSNFHSNTTDSVGAGGSASFTLTNDLTNKTDALSCSLQVNYRCILSGVPSDANLTVNLALRAESVTLLLDESVVCVGRETRVPPEPEKLGQENRGLTRKRNRPLHIIGNGDLDLNCTGSQDIGGRVTCGLAEGENTIQGAAVELAPG